MIRVYLAQCTACGWHHDKGRATIAEAEQDNRDHEATAHPDYVRPVTAALTYGRDFNDHTLIDQAREDQGYREAEEYAADESDPVKRPRTIEDFMTGWRTADRTRPEGEA